MNKRIAPSASFSQHDLIEDTMKRVVPHEALSSAIPNDRDSNFWIALKAGLIALNNWNMWIAALQMQKIASEMLIPLATDYITQQGTGHTLQSYSDGWQCQLEQPSVLLAYQHAISNYHVFSAP